MPACKEAGRIQRKLGSEPQRWAGDNRTGITYVEAGAGPDVARQTTPSYPYLMSGFCLDGNSCLSVLATAHSALPQGTTET